MEVVRLAARLGAWTLKAKSKSRNSKLTSIAWKDKTKMHRMTTVMAATALEVELSFRMLSL